MEPLHKILLLRHAEVELACRGTFCGHQDVNLSENGRNQSIDIAPFLADSGIEAVFSSPMKRVQQTIDPTLKRLRLRHHSVIHDLREVDFGSWTGVKWQDIDDRPDFSPANWMQHLENGEIDDAEPLEDFRDRVDKALETILTPPVPGNLLIASHGGVIRMILSLLLDLPFSRMDCFEADYASVTEVHIHADGRRSIKLLNFRPWKEVPVPA